MPSRPLGSPSQRSPLTVTTVAQAITLPHGIMAIELQNVGNQDVYIGDVNVTSANGFVLYSQGVSKTYENLPSNWKCYVIVATGTSELRVVNYL